MSVLGWSAVFIILLFTINVPLPVIFEVVVHINADKRN